MPRLMLHLFGDIVRSHALDAGIMLLSVRSVAYFYLWLDNLLLKSCVLPMAPVNSIAVKYTQWADINLWS